MVQGNKENQGVPASPSRAKASPGAAKASPPSGLRPANAAEMPRLGGGLTPVQWLCSIAAGDRKIRANARADEAEAIARWIDAVMPMCVSTDRPLRRCGYCQTWHRRPCGEGCYLSLTDPTFEALEAQAAALSHSKERGE